MVFGSIPFVSDVEKAVVDIVETGVNTGTGVVDEVGKFANDPVGYVESQLANVAWDAVKGAVGTAFDDVVDRLAREAGMGPLVDGIEAFARALGDPSKGIVIEDPFFTTNPQCRWEVVAHEFFHLSGLEHFYSTTNPSEAIRCAHHVTELVFDIATGETLGCSKPPTICIIPLPP
jgi:hypothetical protein